MPYTVLVKIKWDSIFTCIKLMLFLVDNYSSPFCEEVGKINRSYNKSQSIRPHRGQEQWPKYSKLGGLSWDLKSSR